MIHKKRKKNEHKPSTKLRDHTERCIRASKQPTRSSRLRTTSAQVNKQYHAASKQHRTSKQRSTHYMTPYPHKDQKPVAFTHKETPMPPYGPTKSLHPQGMQKITKKKKILQDGNSQFLTWNLIHTSDRWSVWSVWSVWSIPNSLSRSFSEDIFLICIICIIYPYFI